jgi:LysR family transcriptional activator of nhaA
VLDDWLNYHHLLYFWAVAKEGSVNAACQRLHVAQPTVSGQIKKLEAALGEKLLERSGRSVALTDIGQVVFRYADEIFSIGKELRDTLSGRVTDRPTALHVGLPEVLPKLIAFRLLEPAMQLQDRVKLICREGPMDQLLAQLATHELDVVFSDSPVGSLTSVRAFNHALGECGVGLFGTPRLCRQYQRNIPESLNGAPFFLPGEHTALRRSVAQWLYQFDVEPEVVGEIDDTALLKVFAEAGMGLIPAPLAIQAEIEKQFGLRLLLEIPNATERFYAITAERKLKHPAVVAISDAVRSTLFGPK